MTGVVTRIRDPHRPFTGVRERNAHCGAQVAALMAALAAAGGCTQLPPDSAAKAQVREQAMACLVQGVRYEHSSIVRAQAVEGLQDHGGDASLRWIRQALHDEDAAVRFAALMALGKKQDRVGESAIRRLAAEGQTSDRIAAIYALHRLGDASRTADLAAYLLDSPDLAARRHAAMVLGYLGEPGAIRLLARVMREDDPGLRANSLESMLMLGADEARATLYANAFSGVGAEEAFAVMALGKLRDRSYSDLYREKVDSAFHMETKLAAARALGMLGDEYGLTVARKALTFRAAKSEKNDPAINRTFRVRQMAAAALGEIGDPAALPDLVKLMVEADDPRLEVAAATALLAILGEPPRSRGTPFDSIQESPPAALAPHGSPVQVARAPAAKKRRTVMKWLPFAILALAAVTLHTTLAPRLAVADIRPDWILLAVVFFAIHARNVDVVIAGWVLGLLADLQTVERFGLLSLAYAAAAAMTYATREHVFRFHPLAHFAVTLVVGAVVQAFLLTFDLFAEGAASVALTHRLASAGLVAVYTALWAPPLYAVLFRLAPWLGLEVPRYSHFGLARLRR